MLQNARAVFERDSTAQAAAAGSQVETRSWIHPASAPLRRLLPPLLSDWLCNLSLLEVIVFSELHEPFQGAAFDGAGS